MKPKIEEVLYSQYEVRNTPSMSIKDIFQCNIDFTIDIDNIIAVEMMWERHHNNTIWCYFGVPKTQEEIVDDGMLGLRNYDNKYRPYGPHMRVDVDLFRKALYYERNDIPYEVYLKLARKYIHVKIRTRCVDG